MTSTRFTDPAAVDAWDQWFRWRNADGLRDRTIDATWWRVADAIAPAEGGRANMRRYVEAFSRWQLLPDERLLRSAGTATGLAPLEAPAAALNVSAFVVAPLTRQARFDAEGFAHVATLAVHLLDDALVTVQGTTPTFRDLRIGLIGMADALALLGIGYGDTDAVELARVVGMALAHGTLRGTVELAHERGAIDRHPAHRVALWRERGMPGPLVDDALRRGVRHARLSAIERQPRLALLANSASDALDPVLSRHRPGAGNTASAQAPLRATQAARTGATAQLALRAAIQPWIDAAIDYPLVTAAVLPQAPLAYQPVAQPAVAQPDGACEPKFRNI